MRQRYATPCDTGNGWDLVKGRRWSSNNEQPKGRGAYNLHETVRKRRKHGKQLTGRGLALAPCRLVFTLIAPGRAGARGGPYHAYLS